MKKKRGVTLVELILAMGIAVLVVAASYALISSGLRSYEGVSAVTGELDTVRLVMANVSKDVRACASHAVSVGADQSLLIDDITYTLQDETLIRRQGTSTTTVAQGVAVFVPEVEYDAGTPKSVQVTVRGTLGSDAVTTRLTLR
ncbi:MAG: prepilin-type N-terminal cleavage/methylation domain-containing protein [Eubacteriales bacterium]|nr:prepilin-type N-terminal cleavage/methylation domain-containing protein [Eubacteriales bacterium]